MSKESQDNLQHAVINQLEADFGENNFEEIGDFLEELIKNEDNHKIIMDYLSDSAKENWLEGKTIPRF